MEEVFTQMTNLHTSHDWVFYLDKKFTFQCKFCYSDKYKGYWYKTFIPIEWYIAFSYFYKTWFRHDLLMKHCQEKLGAYCIGTR